MQVIKLEHLSREIVVHPAWPLNGVKIIPEKVLRNSVNVFYGGGWEVIVQIVTPGVRKAREFGSRVMKKGLV